MSFPALTADKEDVTIEVKDSKGAVHAVKAVNLSKGDAKATFEFEKAVATADLTGKWTIGEASYDFDAIKQLEDIKSAAQGDDVVKLLKALKAGSITDVAETDAALAKYKEAITDAAPKTLAEVQEAIAKANEELAETDAATKAVKAVADAKGQVALLKALEDGFKRVNADWISSYISANSSVGIVINDAPTANTIIVKASEQAVTLTAENIQATIDAINKKQVLTLWDEAWDNADAKKLAEVNALADFLADDTDEQKVVKEYYADEAKRLAAVINVNTVAASTATNGSFVKAVVALDTVENELVAKYKGTEYAKNFVEGLDSATLNEGLLSKYRTELGNTAAKDRNQASDIQKVITAVNEDLATDLLDAVTGAKSVDELLKALKAYGLTDVVEANKEAYYVTDNANFKDVEADEINKKTAKEVAQQIVKDINAAEAFKTTHKATLALTTDEIKAADLPALREANNAYNSLSDAAKTFAGNEVIALYKDAQGKFLYDVNVINGTGNMSEKLELLDNKLYAKLTDVQKLDISTMLIEMRKAESGKKFADFAKMETAFKQTIALYKIAMPAINDATNVKEMTDALEPLSDAGVLSETGNALTLLAGLVLSEKPEAGYASFQEILEAIAQ